MKKLLYTLVVIVLAIGCTKDKGSYNYSNAAIFTITNLDSIVFLREGSASSFAPTVKDHEGNLITASDTAKYSFEWDLYDSRKQDAPAIIADSMNLFLRGKTQVFKSKSKAQYSDSTYTMAWGHFIIMFRITDKKTGYFLDKAINVTYGNDIFEGWLVLGELAKGSSRLGMASLRDIGDTTIKDVISFSKSQFPMSGSPRFVSYTNYSTLDLQPSSSDESISLGTNTMAAPVNPDSFSYSSAVNFASLIRTTPRPSSFNGSYLYNTNLGNEIFFADSSLYAVHFLTSLGTPRFVGPIVDESGSVIKTSSFVGFPFYYGSYSSYTLNYILYDARQHRFLRVPSTATKTALKIDDGSLFKYQDLDKVLEYMQFTTYNGGQVVAILKDKVGDRYICIFTTQGKQISYDKMNATDIDKVTCYAFDPTYGYLFYGSGSKLYEYDLKRKLSIPMVDFGKNKISMLSYQSFCNVTINPYGGKYINSTYESLAKKLIVGSYDESNLDEGGAINLYDVIPVNGPITLYKKYAGFAKPISVTYRER